MMFITALKLLALVGLCTAAESTDRSDDDIARLLVQFIDNPEIAGIMRGLKGSWPFNATSSCHVTNTLDVGYRDYVKQGRDDTEQLQSIPLCGVNIFTSVEKDSSSQHHQQLRNQHQTINGETDVRRELKQLETEIEEFLVNLDSRQKTLSSESTGKRSWYSADDAKSNVGRVVGGHMVQDGAWPWLAAVGSKWKGPRCGGSLIADRWVLTAAHCFKDVEAPCEYNVRLGSRNWLYDDKDTHVDVTVDAIYRHPDFDQQTMANDVALLKLSHTVSLDEKGFINAICLPRGSRSIKTGTSCLAAGWGKLKEGSKSQVFDSQEVELNVLSYSEPCGDYLPGSMKPGMVCVGSEQGGRDTCQGDSGGPLVYRSNDRWILFGITSFGEGCARPKYPGVYTEVGYHLKWITAVMLRFS